MICNDLSWQFFLVNVVYKNKKLHKKKVVAVQVVHPYFKLNLDHLKTTKIRRNIHMTSESKNLESGVLTCLTIINSLTCVNARANPIYSNGDNLNVLVRHFKHLIPLATSSIEFFLIRSLDIFDTFFKY
jgi:hypothetical protein